MKKIVSIIALVVFSATFLFSQSANLQVTSTAGGYTKTDDGSVTWTVGEPATETLSNDNIVITQGFNQPVFKITSIKDTDSQSKFNVNIFPNPASDFLFLDVPNELVDGNYEIYTIEGKKVINKNITADKTKVDLKHLNKNSYIIKINDSKGQAVKSYKIQKIE